MAARSDFPPHAPHALTAVLLSLLAANAQAAPVDIRIPAQALAQALQALGQQTGLQVLYQHELVAGARSTSVTGRMEPEEALARLLRGQNIQYAIRDNTITLRRATAASMLAPVAVIGQRTDEDTVVAKASAAGTKTLTPLNEIPQSISVVTAAQMRAQNSQTLGDAVRYTPGIVVQEGFNRSDDPFIIRGFDVRTNPGVMYRDGLKLPLPHYSAVAEPYGLERVEIAKGPSSVLYGQAAPGGIVNTVTKRPTREPLRELQVTGGSHDHKQVAGDFGGALDADGKVLFRLTALGRDSGTQIDHIPDDRYYIAPALTLNLGADTSLTLLASYLRNKTINNAGYPLEGMVRPNPNGAIPSRRFTGEPDWSKWDQETGTVGYLFSHRLNDTWQFRQNLSHAQSRNRVNHAYWWSWVPGSNFARAERGAYQRDDDAHGTSIDNQFQATWQTGPVKHDVLFGLDYTQTSLTREQYAGYNNLAPIDFFSPSYGSSVTLPTNPDTYTVERRSQTGLYLQDQMKLHDKLVLVLGGRYDDADGSTANRLNGTRTRLADTHFSWRAGMLYLADNGLSPYLSYATSFQPQSGTTAPARGARPFDPTEGKQWELGVKYEPPGSQSVLTASVFSLTRSNVPTTDPANPTYNIQAGEVRSRGVELSATAEMARNWNVIAAYTYTDAEVTRSNNATLGTRPEAVPRHMASLWTDYTLGDGLLNGLNLGAGVRYLGSTFNTGNTAKVDDYTLVDVSLRYDLGAAHPDFKGMSVDLNVRNLFDKEYVASCTYACFYGERRTVLGRLSYRW